MYCFNNQQPAPRKHGKCFVGRVLLRLSRIKRYQVILMGKFGPTALNFGYDIFILITFSWHSVVNENLHVSLFADISRNKFCFFITKRYSSSGEYWWNIWSWPSMNINISKTLCLSPHSFPEILTFLAMQDLYWQIFWAFKLVGIEKNEVW